MMSISNFSSMGSSMQVLL